MSPVKKSKVSQQDIARDLGVSQALVSMVLNGQSKGIHADTFRRIREHARSLGYRLRNGRNGSEGQLTQVGFILRPGHTLYSQSSVYSHIQHGLHTFLEREGLNTLFLGTVTSISENAFQNIERLRQTLLGAVVMGEVDFAFLENLKARLPKLVMVAANSPGHCHSVMNNEAQTMEKLVDHLVELGHGSFAWIGGNTGSKALERRFEALRLALGRHGLDCPADHTEIFGNPKQREGAAAARHLIERFSRKTLPTAWVCYNGRMARGVVSHLQASRINVPRDVSVVACDGTYICEDEEPTLTGAYADPEEIGILAGQLLLQASGKSDEPFTDVIVPAALNVRQSSGPRQENVRRRTSPV